MDKLQEAIRQSLRDALEQGKVEVEVLTYQLEEEYDPQFGVFHERKGRRPRHSEAPFEPTIFGFEALVRVAFPLRFVSDGPSLALRGGQLQLEEDGPDGTDVVLAALSVEDGPQLVRRAIAPWGPARLAESLAPPMRQVGTRWSMEAECRWVSYQLDLTDTMPQFRVLLHVDVEGKWDG